MKEVRAYNLSQVLDDDRLKALDRACGDKPKATRMLENIFTVWERLEDGRDNFRRLSGMSEEDRYIERTKDFWQMTLEILPEVWAMQLMDAVESRSK